MTSGPVQKYLEKYAENESRLAGWDRQYAFSLVIPAHRESAVHVKRVTKALPHHERLLVIVVINDHDPGDSMAGSLEQELTADHEVTRLSDNTMLVRSGSPDYLLVDRFRDKHAIAPRQGVGLARKIGCDIALALYHRDIVDSEWLHTTDADATLPADYFEQTGKPGVLARVLPFRHAPDPGLETACQLYDIRLLYHVAGLRWAGSAYAYPAIGSLMQFSAHSYAAVRGFPKRATGEDFYLLNKLCKLGNIQVTAGSPVTLAGRRSHRVPLGTGRALEAISRLPDPVSDYQLEHPDCYRDLLGLLKELSQLAQTLPGSYQFKDPVFHDYALSAGLYEQYERKRSEDPKPAVMARHLSGWFDGLKTRRLVHRLRDERHGAVPVSGLYDAPFIDDQPADIPSLRAALFNTVYRA